MAVTAYWYGNVIMNQFGGSTEAATYYPIDYLTDAIYVTLHTSSYAVNQDTDVVWSSCAASEEPYTGNYTGKLIDSTAPKTLSYSSGSNAITFGAGNITWANSTILNALYAVIFKKAGTTSTSPLMIYVNFGVNSSSGGGSFVITWAAGGIATITVT